MAQLKFILGAALAASLSTAATAQSSHYQSITSAETDIVRAQTIREGDVSPEEYAALLAEADRIRATQSTTYTSPTAGAISKTDSYGYQIEIFEAPSASTDIVSANSPTQYPMAKTYPLGTDFSSPEFFSQRASTVYSAPTNYGNTTTYSAPTYSQNSLSASTGTTSYAPAATYQSTASTSHYVVKGDTLYNISKRMGVSVSALKSANGLSDNTISLGQTLTVPGSQRFVSVDSYVSPSQTTITQPYSSGSRPTLVRNTEPLPTSDNYAVLPKDTLYSIARRACVSVFDISAVNGNLDPQTLQPGQRIALPGGHCMR